MLMSMQLAIQEHKQVHRELIVCDCTVTCDPCINGFESYTAATVQIMWFWGHVLGLQVWHNIAPIASSFTCTDSSTMNYSNTSVLH